MIKRGGKEPAEERGKGTPWSLHCRWPPSALLYLTHHPTPFRFPFFFCSSFVISRGSWGSRVLGWLAGGMAVFAPPLGSHGEGYFDAWGTAGGLCVLGVGFLCFPAFFTPHPPAGPFPTPGPCVFTLLSGCLFLSLFLSLSGTLSGLCLWCSCLLCQIRDTFQVPKALSDHSVLCWFFLFFLLSFVTSFSFCFFTPTLAAVRPPPHTEMGIGDILPAGSENDIRGGGFRLPRLTKIK